MCDVRGGTQRDAILHSVGANATHGLPRKQTDKERAVNTLLDDPEWQKRSENWIAETARVSNGLVSRLKKGHPTFQMESCGKTVGKDGKTRDTSNIGKNQPSKPPILCERCQRVAAGVGIKDCPECKEARKKPSTQDESDDGHLWLTDGWHTEAAHRLKGKTEIQCVVTSGDWLDAVVAAAGANANHGLRRNPKDTKRAVEIVSEEFKR